MPLAVINCGSSSIKYRLFASHDLRERGGGSIEAIGTRLGRHMQRRVGEAGDVRRMESPVDAQDHSGALELVLDALADLAGDDGGTLAIAHRVVHGGDRYRKAVLVVPEVLAELVELSSLAPLHNPVNLAGIEAAGMRFPAAPQVAVFDTAFHQHMPPAAYLYGVPREWFEHFSVRRYGFHGISHSYVTLRAADTLGKPAANTNLIILHLGNGASATAVQNGRSIDNSMGMTPLAGLMMGTRCGDLDPSVLLHMIRRQGMDAGQLETALNKASGFKGLTGESDMREVISMADSGDRWAALAVDAYCYQVRKIVGAFHAVLSEVDALVFTGGVGEHNTQVRAACCRGIEHLGFTLDADRNASTVGVAGAIHSTASAKKILVEPTDEELQIAREALSVLPAED